MDLTKIDELAPQLETMKKDELTQTLKSIKLLLSKAKDCIIAMEKPDTATATPNPVDKSLFDFQHDSGLNTELLADLSKHVKTLKYHPNPVNPSSPQIYLYGSQRYSYNEQSASLTPAPIIPGSIMEQVLETVNTKLSTSFNSILINKYKDVNCSLGFHKDDEHCLDPASPISTLSVGKATRRMLISLNASKHTPAEEVVLTPGSILTMMPGFPDNYWHSVPAGRKNIGAERGMRYSLTFRKLLPSEDKHAQVPTTAAVAPATTDDAPVTQPDSSVPDPSYLPADKAIVDTFVFGSSLVKGLDEKLLSKHSKKFKVFSNSGALIGDIYDSVEKVVTEGEYDTTKVSNIFLLCGGNDVENFKEDAVNKFTFLTEDFEDLVWYTREAFPHAKLHVLSMIPRRAKYRTHIKNMHKVNNWLNEFCRKEGIRYVDIFSFFLVKTPSIWYINKKLYNNSELHFSKIGDSVLSKVLIGVANLPR